MDSPNQIIQFIQRNKLSYILGHTVRAIMYANMMSFDQDLNKLVQLQHLKDARQFLNIEIKRLSKEKK
jgi:hypothetical protein